MADLLIVLPGIDFNKLLFLVKEQPYHSLWFVTVQQLQNVHGDLIKQVFMYPCRLLIIDDDKDDVEILSEAMHQSGFDSFYFVGSAEEAINFLSECSTEDALPRLIVTDLYLPAMNGLQFIKTLQQSMRYNKIPVIILSSTKFEIVIDFHKNLKADYIEKPSSYQDYLKVAALLNQKSAA